MEYSPPRPHEQSVYETHIDMWCARPSYLFKRAIPESFADHHAVKAVEGHWGTHSRFAQRPSGSDWDVWLMMAGRGFGKTRAGAEWVKGLVGDGLHRGPQSGVRIALVAATIHEARSVMVEGESGILNLYAEGAADRPTWEPSLRTLTWPSGATATTYGAAEADSLRGPQHHYAWADEIAKWPNADAVWQNLRLGLRLGKAPRVLATTTPKSTPLVLKLAEEGEATRAWEREERRRKRKGEEPADAAIEAKVAKEMRRRVRMSNGSTHDNGSNLPLAFRREMEAEYGGTRLGRQEIMGELVTEVEGAQLSLSVIEEARVAPVTPEEARARMVRVAIAVDPCTTGNGDACGIVAVGVEEVARGGVAGGGSDGVGGKNIRRAVLLEDGSLDQPEPAIWAAQVMALYRKWGAGSIIAEGNQGGKMVSTIIASEARDDADIAHVPVKIVHARQGKSARAEPVTHAYQKGKVVHAGRFEMLEEQMCGYTKQGGYAGPGRSPDRADAMVWAVTWLLLDGKQGWDDGPRVRVL